MLAQPPFARVGGRTQLEHLRQDQAQGKPKERSQLGGHAKADKLGSSSTAGQGAGRRLQGARVEKWDSDSDSDKSDMPMTRRGSWCRGEAVEAGRRAGGERGRTGRETVRRETRGCIGRHKQRTYLTDVFTVPWRVDTYCITYLTHE